MKMLQYNIEPPIITKVKMFAAANMYELETDINQFIKNKAVVDIKYSQVVNHVHMAMVIYREYEEDVNDVSNN